MPLRTFTFACDNLEYVSDNDFKEEREYEMDYVFLIEGFIKSENQGFFTVRRGRGTTYTEALDDAYNRVYNRLKYKHNLIVDAMVCEDSYRSCDVNAQMLHNTGHSFYNLSPDFDIHNYVSTYYDHDTRPHNTHTSDQEFLQC